MPKPSNVLNIKPRTMQGAVPEALARALEDAAEAMGNGVAGSRGREAVASQAHDEATPQGHEPVASQAREAVASQGTGTMHAPRVRKDGTRTRSTSMHMPIDLGKRLAVYCAERGTKQNDVLVAALERFLAEG